MILNFQVELDEVESRNEEYPMTRAFLDLLTSLTDTPVPVALGAGTRVPGFDPYLQFVMDVVFLRFGSRAYKDPAEKVSLRGSYTIKVIKIRSHEIY